LRILHIISGLNTGGAEIMLARLCACLSELGFENRVVSLTGEGPVSEILRNSGVGIRTLGLRPGHATFAAWRELRSEVVDYCPSVVHGWMYHGGLAARSAVQRPRRPALVLGIHYSLIRLCEEKTMTRMVIRGLAWLSSSFDSICYVSEKSAAEHEAIGYSPVRRRVIPNGIDCSFFRPTEDLRQETRAELGLRSTDLVIGMLARYHPMKNFPRFFAAAKRLAARHPEARFMCAGRGVDWSNGELTRIIREAEVESRTLLLGECADVKPLLAAMDIATLSSSWGEAFPLSLAEAMSMGVPCVGPVIGDIPNLIGDPSLLVPPDGVSSLYEAWARLAAMGEGGRRAIGERARRRVEERYSLNEGSRRYAALYADAVADSRSN